MKGVEVVASTGDVLGEGAYWCPVRGRLLWVDIMKQKLHELDPGSGKVRTSSTPQKVHALRVAQGGRYIATAHRHGLAWLDADTGQLEGLVNPEPDASDNILNDGCCDAMGRFWFGSLNKKHQATGALYSIDGRHRVTRHMTGIGIANGIAIGPDSTCLYVNDTYVGLYALDFDLGSGAATNPRLIFTPTERTGWLDGMAVDTEGCLWIAMALAGRIMRLTPSGVVDRTVDIPARFVTSCVFGGPDLTTLYVTTATAGRPADELEAEPLAGSVFAVDVGYRGLAQSAFAGSPQHQLNPVEGSPAC